MAASVPFWAECLYFLVSIVLITGLQQMASPLTAQRGIVYSGWAMLVAALCSVLLPGGASWLGVLSALGSGAAVAYAISYRVQMTEMPQMIALFNGMGGGAAAAIAGLAVQTPHGVSHVGLAILTLMGGAFGSLSFTGSLVAFAKLQGYWDKSWALPAHQWLNGLTLLMLCGLGGMYCLANEPHFSYLIAFFAVAAWWGVGMTLPIGGADMPVVISLYNALTGLAVAFEGFSLGNSAMIIAGTVVGASGALLTHLMATAMNRRILHIVTGATTGSTYAVAGDGSDAASHWKEATAEDVAALLAYAERVIVVPGYGMAVAQAQHKVWELCQLLLAHGVEVQFAIHPVAGRMPGHMNVLLAEAGVPYERIADLEAINADFPHTDVCLVIGANDVVNPVARSDKDSPIYGMPILDADAARHIIVVKRGRGTGFSGVQNALFSDPKTRLLYGDAQRVITETIQAVKPYLHHT